METIPAPSKPKSNTKGTNEKNRKTVNCILGSNFTENVKLFCDFVTLTVLFSVIYSFGFAEKTCWIQILQSNISKLIQYFFPWHKTTPGRYREINYRDGCLKMIFCFKL